jgi:hypothetical protein
MFFLHLSHHSRNTAKPVFGATEDQACSFSANDLDVERDWEPGKGIRYAVIREVFD